ncbi:4-O-methyl-glucuronoyl methylesterase 1-like isoform X2 [Cimex lectularius]|uniref:Uncharacterized protein n=1 Tax=Cimex lectularius TaxID=79782 RepID=A0A8I6RDH9_CIMLE|nr:4-O-methyl-glucuronoyl methylesterase 1-like isoform X2 [Cimex lectularius]
MLRFLAIVFLFEIALHGQGSAASEVTIQPIIDPTTTLSPSSPTTTTTIPPTTNTPITSPTTKPPTTKPPTTKPPTTTPPTTTPPTTTPPTTTPPHTTTPNTTTIKPEPSTTPSPSHPSDRKFDAFSFLGGFCLALGLVAIGFLGWKFYVSRHDSVYHTL